MRKVVILAAGTISGKLGFLRSRCPSPALIPINTRPLAAYLLDFYATQKDCCVQLVVNAEVAETIRAELGVPNGRYEVMLVESTSGVVDSLAQAMKNNASATGIIVNLVTTVPTQLVQTSEVLVSNQATRSSHWSGVILESKQPRFSFKCAPHPLPSHGFTGVFGCSSADLIGALESTEQRNDLLAVVEQLEKRQPLRYTPCEWIDCGHETNYYEAKAKLICSRSFNQIHVSLGDGVLSKSSQDTEKLHREVDYMEMLPPDIRVYFPRVLRQRSEIAALGVQMEYYGYPNVAEYFLYWELSADNWRRLFAHLQSALRRFTAFPYSISYKAFEEFYLEKTVTRIDQFLQTLEPALRQALEEETVINGMACQPFASLIEKLKDRIRTLYREADFCVMHGDFCFNNILYDVPSGIVRLIDPRGSFGDRCVGIYGDRKYDLAKLKHSAEHGYDFLVNGLFTLRHDHHRFDYTFASRESAALVADLSRELIAECGYDDGEITLLTSLLFLSMCPLHADDFSRQVTMYVHGLRLLNLSL